MTPFFFALVVSVQLEGVEPLASPDDCLLAEEIAKADPGVQEQLKQRGVTDVSLVACDPWSGWYLLSSNVFVCESSSMMMC